MFGQFSVRKKLGYSQVGTCIALVGMCTFAWWAMNSIVQHSKAMQERSRIAQTSARLAEDTQRLRAAQHAQEMYTFAVNDELVRRSREEFDKTLAQMQKDIAEVQPALHRKEASDALASAAAALAKLPQIHAEIDRLFSQGQGMESLAYGATALTPVFDQMDAGFQHLSEAELRDLEEERKSAESVYVQCNVMLALMSIFALVTVGLGIYLITMVTGRLSHVSVDLTQNSQHVAEAAAQVRQFSEALAQGASEQASSLQETSSSTSQITAMTKQNAENAGRAAQLVGETLSHVEHGNTSVAEMIESMREIRASSQQISKIMKLIDEISFQTNILSLNAAVEAARAGEAGMGFAVVADEVRNLAQRCAQAAKDTSQLVEVAHKRTDEGMRKLQQVEGAIGQITAATAQLKVLMDEVSLSSSEQQKGLDQITRAVEQMEQLTHRNAASAEQGAASAQEMGHQSQNLREAVQQLESFLGHREETFRLQ